MSSRAQPLPKPIKTLPYLRTGFFERRVPKIFAHCLQSGALFKAYSPLRPVNSRMSVEPGLQEGEGRRIGSRACAAKDGCLWMGRGVPEGQRADPSPGTLDTSPRLSSTLGRLTRPPGPTLPTCTPLYHGRCCVSPPWALSMPTLATWPAPPLAPCVPVSSRLFPGQGLELTNRCSTESSVLPAL